MALSSKMSGYMEHSLETSEAYPMFVYNDETREGESQRIKLVGGDIKSRSWFMSMVREINT
jgi:hypothetical protein